ncbi:MULTISPECIES: hypothetical protein [unclassified Streptomyces]|uniref:hypothetical protein n=1 Tax=unclassified Streptomyces TaxID=2593676 RepID=UPI0018FEC997|nr:MULTISPECIES: hypothetical protein [unclassified Streptomyces]
MDQVPDLPRPRQRGDQLSLYASTASEEAEGDAATLVITDPGEPRSVTAWWNDLVPFGADLPQLEGNVFAAALRLRTRLQQVYPGVDVRLRMGPRSAWLARDADRQAEWKAMKRPPLPQRVEDLIKQLSPECSLCGTTARELQIAHIVDWPQTRRLVEAEPSNKDMPLRATLMFHNPWNMLRLCRDYVHRSGCHDRQERGEITEQDVRAARAALDLLPGADRAYGAFLDQGLQVGNRKLPIDMNAISAAMTHLVAPAQQDGREGYLLRQGSILVDRARGSISWGNYNESDLPEAPKEDRSASPF